MARFRSSCKVCGSNEAQTVAPLPLPPKAQQLAISFAAPPKRSSNSFYDLVYGSLRLQPLYPSRPAPFKLSTTATRCDLYEHGLNGGGFSEGDGFAIRGTEATPRAVHKTWWCYIIVKTLELRLRFPVPGLTSPRSLATTFGCIRNCSAAKFPYDNIYSLEYASIASRLNCICPSCGGYACAPRNTRRH
uniref:HDC02658 n=1 Tax=Drosophila melanogaster TaxID=7227 RepID=Q6IHF3_DROME|nr:TPA_inf: HDC02658 [Drosophila melanogaster]